MTEATPSCWAHMQPEERAQFWASLALRHVRGLGPRSCVSLLRHFGSALAAMENISQWGEALVDSRKANEAATGSWRVTALEEWKSVQQSAASVLMWHHKEYPELLQRLVDAPTLLYCLGNTALLQGPCFAVVGSRECTTEGVRVAGDVARTLSGSGLTIVSGMARGIDRVAHVAALSGLGSSIAVLGTGIDRIYPEDNSDLFYQLEKQGLLVTEFAPQTAPIGSNFPVRNRIISGLSLGVVVVEGTLRSGSMVTARLALEQNRDVFAIPGPTTSASSRGCQELVRQGARAVFSGEDILQDMAEQLKSCDLLRPENEHMRQKFASSVLPPADENAKRTNGAGQKDLIAHNSLTSMAQISQANRDSAENYVVKDAEEGMLYLLQAHGPSHVDTLCALLGQPVGQVNALLIEMEVAGLIKRLPGARYEALVSGNN